MLFACVPSAGYVCVCVWQTLSPSSTLRPNHAIESTNKSLPGLLSLKQNCPPSFEGINSCKTKKNGSPFCSSPAWNCSWHHEDKTACYCHLTIAQNKTRPNVIGRRSLLRCRPNQFKYTVRICQIQIGPLSTPWTGSQCVWKARQVRQITCCFWCSLQFSFLVIFCFFLVFVIQSCKVSLQNLKNSRRTQEQTQVIALGMFLCR